MCGEKCREAVICADQLTVARNCTSMQGNELTSVLHHAIDAGQWLEEALERIQAYGNK